MKNNNRKYNIFKLYFSRFLIKTVFIVPSINFFRFLIEIPLDELLVTVLNNFLKIQYP